MILNKTNKPKGFLQDNLGTLFRTLIGILLMRYVVVKNSSPRYFLGKLLMNMRDLAIVYSFS